MLSVRNAACKCPKTITLLLSCRVKFRFRASTSCQHRNMNSNAVEAMSPKRPPNKTKKMLKDLPRARLQASGIPATPLVAWDGGLGDPGRVPLELCDGKADASTQRSTGSKSLSTTLDGKSRRHRKSTVPRSPDTLIASSPAHPQTPLANEIIGNLTRFPHCILLTRVGQFYESYFDQATEVAKLLNIKLATKSWGGGRVPMCGFPLTHLDKHLKVLVQQQQRFVAICEEFMREPGLGPKGGFDRRVTRIVTPGTLIDEPFLNPYQNNYLLAIVPQQDGPLAHSSGLAWIDISTGDFFTQDVSDDGLRDYLVRINPREVILGAPYQHEPNHPVCLALAEENLLISYTPIVTSSDVPARLEAEVDDDDVTSFLHGVSAEALTGAGLEAVLLLTSFMRDNLREHMPELSAPRREANMSRMQIDSHTIKALEIRETMAEGATTGSLLSIVKRTVTTSGTRLLARWLCSPSTSLSEINARQSLVAFFKSRPHLRVDLVRILCDIEDVCRIAQKFRFGRGDLDDLVAVHQTVNLWSSIQRRIQLEKEIEQRERGVLKAEWASLDALMTRMSSLQTLTDRISSALIRRGDVEKFAEVNEAGGSTSDILEGASGGWAIRPQFSQRLLMLHELLSVLKQRRTALERELQLLYDVPSLTLRTSPQQSFHIHIARAKRDASRLKSKPDRFTLLSETASTCSFFYQDWSILGTKIVETSTEIQIAEREAFEILRDRVNMYGTELRRNSRILDELDVTLAFANVAEELKFIRPVMRDDTCYHVTGGRHPSVELGLLSSGRTFTPNNVSFTPDGPLHIVTGPNMAGKSTILRQTALIAILAQTGSFVPAESAELGVVDHVFSRIGAKDDLFRDRSTFMVEMLETADILRRATPRSLVIMDEVGRGTTVIDGVAIAFATIHHLLTVNRCRTMFATHFHELADMLGCSDDHRGAGTFSLVRFFCTDVDEASDGFFAYSHRLRPGINRDSHGLKVAQLAGLPTPAVKMASVAVSWFKQRSLSDEDKAQLRTLGQTLCGQES